MELDKGVRAIIENGDGTYTVLSNGVKVITTTPILEGDYEYRQHTSDRTKL